MNWDHWLQEDWKVNWNCLWKSAIIYSTIIEDPMINLQLVNRQPRPWFNNEELLICFQCIKTGMIWTFLRGFSGPSGHLMNSWYFGQSLHWFALHHWVVFLSGGKSTKNSFRARNATRIDLYVHHACLQHLQLPLEYDRESVICRISHLMVDSFQTTLPTTSWRTKSSFSMPQFLGRITKVSAIISAEA